MASTLQRAAVLRRAVSFAAPSPAARLPIAPRRPFSQPSAASGDQPPKSALDKLNPLFEEVMRKGVCSMDQYMTLEIVKSIQHARIEFNREERRKSWMVCYVVIVGLIGYVIRKRKMITEQDGNAGSLERKRL